MSRASYLELWYEALNSEIGITVHCETQKDQLDLRTRLYQIRKDHGDPDLEVLSILVSPENPQTDLWIMRRQI